MNIQERSRSSPDLYFPDRGDARRLYPAAAGGEGGPQATEIQGIIGDGDCTRLRVRQRVAVFPDFVTFTGCKITINEQKDEARDNFCNTSEICNASVFLGKQGVLNGRKHTSNDLEYLQQCAGEKYTGEAEYINEQAVRDGNLVTANGTGALEFCREILYALEVDTPEKIEENYQFYKRGLVK